MVDLSKHLQRARQALERRQYDIAIGVFGCQEIDPANLENASCWLILPNAVPVRVQSFSLGFGGFSRDPQRRCRERLKACQRPRCQNVSGLR